MKNKKYCIWKEDIVGDYKTECKNEYQINEELNFLIKYCPYCGKEIKVKD